MKLLMGIENTQADDLEGQEHNRDVILVVEDDDALLRLIKRCLQQRGFQTHGVTSGSAAVSWLRANTPRLMLLDYSLSDMQGEELLNRLEAHGKCVPFVVVTGHGSESNVAAEMIRRGAKACVVKDTSFMEQLPTVVARAMSS